MLAPRLELSEEEAGRCFDVRLLAGLAMTAARKAGQRAVVAWRVCRHWIIESTARKRDYILLQDIGLRVWAETMAMKANRAAQQDAASDDMRGSEGFLVTHEVGTAEAAAGGGTYS